MTIKNKLNMTFNEVLQKICDIAKPKNQHINKAQVKQQSHLKKDNKKEKRS